MGEFPPLRRRLCLFCSLNCVIEFGVSPAGVWHGLWKRQMCSCVSASVIRRRRDCERPNILNAESWPARCRRQLAFRHCCHVCCAKWARNNAEPGLSIHNQRKERTETRRCEREIASRQPIFFTFFFLLFSSMLFPLLVLLSSFFSKTFLAGSQQRGRLHCSSRVWKFTDLRILLRPLYSLYAFQTRHPES